MKIKTAEQEHDDRDPRVTSNDIWKLVDQLNTLTADHRSRWEHPYGDDDPLAARFEWGYWRGNGLGASLMRDGRVLTPPGSKRDLAAHIKTFIEGFEYAHALRERN